MKEKDVSGICMSKLNFLTFIVPEVWTSIRTDRAKSTRLLILVRNITILYGRKRFLHIRHILYIFWLRPLAKVICRSPSVCLSVEILGSIKARKL